MSSEASRSVGLPTVVGRWILVEISWLLQVIFLIFLPIALIIAWVRAAILEDWRGAAAHWRRTILLFAKAVPDIEDWLGTAADIFVDRLWLPTISLFGFDSDFSPSVRVNIVSMLLIIPLGWNLGFGFWDGFYGIDNLLTAKTSVFVLTFRYATQHIAIAGTRRKRPSSLLALSPDIDLNASIQKLHGKVLVQWRFEEEAVASSRVSRIIRGLLGLFLDPIDYLLDAINALKQWAEMRLENASGDDSIFNNMLVKASLRFELRGTDIQYLVHRMVERKSVPAMMEKIVDRFPETLSVRYKGSTPFDMTAALEPTYRKLLVEMFAEADMKHRDVNGENGLHRACRRGDCLAVKHLARKDITCVVDKTGAGELPLFLLCSPEGKDETVLRSAGYVEAIWYLLNQYPEALF
ncbi:hypothetical protein THAOC_12617 [Thalassiosira oceanica]|uniref:Uncharacterized protein n=1 Tax=Thalassiosira oceanica TaxID=159749 RepID=K0SM82_THAOC|nr:hypothetical protein THAOC_12617 [Thalassiosira oceanica]|eukprot:EJK66465.1 hypothetical protein THAOC_12617 [Thalassiosira oceanica]